MRVMLLLETNVVDCTCRAQNLVDRMETCEWCSNIFLSGFALVSWTSVAEHGWVLLSDSIHSVALSERLLALISLQIRGLDRQFVKIITAQIIFSNRKDDTRCLSVFL